MSNIGGHTCCDGFLIVETKFVPVPVLSGPVDSEINIGG
jgi:hypothetical protein